MDMCLMTISKSLQFVAKSFPVTAVQNY